MSRLTLYDYAASANCFKVRLLLRQLGIDYERVSIDIFDGDTLTDEYARLNPFRSTPVLVLPDGTPLIESNAISGSWRGTLSSCPRIRSARRRSCGG